MFMTANQHPLEIKPALYKGNLNTSKAVLISKSFKKFADEVKLPREMSARERFIVQSLQAERQFDEENQ